MKKLFKHLWLYLKPFMNWRFLISFGMAWMITNGWCYLFIGFGTAFNITWMLSVGIAYASFLYFPCTPEKLVTIPIAIFIHTRLFKRDKRTHYRLLRMYVTAKRDWHKVKEKFMRKKHKMENKNDR